MCSEGCARQTPLVLPALFSAPFPEFCSREQKTVHGTLVCGLRGLSTVRAKRMWYVNCTVEMGHLGSGGPLHMISKGMGGETAAALACMLGLPWDLLTHTLWLWSQRNGGDGLLQ